MPNLHDIEKRIRSVGSTKQITRTMEMVAGAKVKQATDRVAAAGPYAASMSEMLTGVASRVQANENTLLERRANVKRVLAIVVVSDRGLAGGFNSNALRATEALVRARTAENAEVDVIACGKKAGSFLNYRVITPVLSFSGTSADPTIEQAQEISDWAISAYETGSIDEVVLIYNHAKNAAEQVLVQETVLPVSIENVDKPKEDKDQSASSEADLAPDMEFEPDPAAVLDNLLPTYVRTSIYHALLDSAAGEQAARRSAMHSATENANEMVETLSRIYNRVRQSAITTEISEIVGGAAALEE